jgi:hypothetical protein
MGNFDYKKYLAENKLTSNSRLNEEEQIDMFDAITVDKDMSVKDAYTKFLMNFARTAGEESPEKLSPNELDKKYTGEIRRKYKITSPFTFSNMGIDLETKGLIKRTADSRLSETTTDNVSDYDDGIYIAINKKPTPEVQAQIAKEANKEFFVDIEEIKFEENPNTGEYSVFIPFAGDYSNMLDVLEKFGIRKRPYTSPHLR